MGMLEDILGQVLKTAVDRVGKEVTGQASPKSPPPVQTPAPTGDPLTQILASVLGADKKDANPILVIILKFIEANGGIMAIITKFQQSGMKAEADSWVGTGPNKLISADHVEKVFDQKSLKDLGKSLGTTPAGAADTLAKVLPELINQFSPTGNLPPNETAMLAMFMQLLGSK